MEIKILFYLFILSLIVNYFRNRKQGVLFCGLWCYVGNEPADPMKLKFLAMYNVSRGDHATGICVNNTIIKETVRATEFLKKHGNLLEVSPEVANYTILGHCRSATSGYSKDNVSFAHPHKIVKGSSKEDWLYLVHNGTITNLSDLCDKYEIDYNFNKYSDSIQIARIIAQTWENEDKTIFRDYDGSATLIFYLAGMDNKLYVHRDQARELFYWQETPNKTYISSIKDSLLIIGGTEETVHEFKHGILTEFTDGAITSEVDYSNKTPYSKPKPVYTRVPAKYEPREKKKIKSGFYWDNHLIYKNGHLFTGSFFVKGREARDFMNDNSWLKYFVVHGVIMKDEDAYNKMCALCKDSKKNAFDPKNFKKITPLELSKWSLYPVPATFGNSQNNQAFWSPMVYTMRANPAVTEFKWEPILSGQIIAIDQIGMHKSTMFLSSPRPSVKEFIREKIDESARSGQPYRTVGELFSEFKEETKVSVNNGTFDNFCDYVFDELREAGMLTTDEESEIQRAKDAEFTRVDFHEDNTYHYTLGKYLSQVCKGAHEMIQDYENIEDEDIEPVQDYLADASYYNMPHFRNQLLFSSYESLDDALENYVATNEDKNVRPFLIGVALLFKDLSWVNQDVVEEAKTRPINEVKSVLSRLFDNLREETFFKDLMETYTDRDTDLHDQISLIYFEIDALSKKLPKTEKDKTNLEVYKLCLSFIVKTAKSLDNTKLLEKYKISRMKLEEICLQ